MKNIYITFLILAMTLCTIRCRKDYPAQPVNVTSFSFTGTVGGNAVNLQSGINNYYMATSYTLDADGIYNYTGELRDKDCSSNCSDALKISFRDYRAYSVYPTSIDSLIVPGYFSIATPAGNASVYYTLFWDTLYNGAPQSYLWDFGDGTTSIVHNPAHVYRHPGVYNVTLVTSTGLCSSTISNEIVIGQAGNAFSVNFHESSTAGTTIHFGGGLGGVPPVTWLVDFGDGTNTTGTGWSHTYATQGLYQASLSVTDATGYKAVKHVNAATETEVLCHNDFSLTDTIAVGNPINLSDVIVEWRDESGTLFTSANDNQPMSSMFQIISVENFLSNSDGHPTRKIKAKISCTLYSTVTDMAFTGDVVFSVAYF